MQIVTKHNAGDKVWIAFHADQNGEKFAKIFGPVTVCKVEVTASQTSKNTTTDVTYHCNALREGYREMAVHASLKDALAYLQVEAA